LRQKQSSLLTDLQIKASIWCEKNDLFEEAISYALAAKNWERALTLLESVAFKLLSVAKFDRIKHWAEAVPENVLRSHPMACYWYVPSLLYREEFEKAEEYLKMIGAAASGELREKLMTALWSSRCYITIARADVEKSLEYSKKSVDLLQPGDLIQG